MALILGIETASGSKSSAIQICGDSSGTGVGGGLGMFGALPLRAAMVLASLRSRGLGSYLQSQVDVPSRSAEVSW